GLRCGDWAGRSMIDITPDVCLLSKKHVQNSDVQRENVSSLDYDHQSGKGLYPDHKPGEGSDTDHETGECLDRNHDTGEELDPNHDTGEDSDPDHDTVQHRQRNKALSVVRLWVNNQQDIVLRRPSGKGVRAETLEVFKLFYHGVDGKRNGVGGILKEEYSKSVVEVKRVSDRVMNVKLEVEGMMINVISAYAPQVGCEMKEKKNSEEVYGCGEGRHAGCLQVSKPLSRMPMLGLRYSGFLFSLVYQRKEGSREDRRAHASGFRSAEQRVLTGTAAPSSPREGFHTAGGYNFHRNRTAVWDVQGFY
ncbi:hypothetical protein HF521_020956, partial [Silurus meridionalis]